MSAFTYDLSHTQQSTTKRRRVLGVYSDLAHALEHAGLWALKYRGEASVSVAPIRNGVAVVYDRSKSELGFSLVAVLVSMSLSMALLGRSRP